MDIVHSQLHTQIESQLKKRSSSYSSSAIVCVLKVASFMSFNPAGYIRTTQARAQHYHYPAPAMRSRRPLGVVVGKALNNSLVTKRFDFGIGVAESF